MDLTILTDDLARELGPCRKLTDGKLPLEIYSAVYLQAEMGLLRLSASNGVVSLRTSCPAQVDTLGALAVPAKTLDEIARRLPGAQLKLAEKAGTLSVSGGGFRATLQLPPVDDYPKLADVDGLALQSLPSASFRYGLGLVRFAADGTDAKFQGVLLEMLASNGSGELRLVATDAHRLALSRIPCGYTGERSTAFVPRQAIDLLIATLDANKGATTVGYGQRDGYLFFQAGQRTVVTRPLESVFPAYERIVKQPHDKRAEVGRALLTDALHRGQIAADDSGAVRMTFRNGELGIEGRSAKVGQAAETVKAAYAADEVALELNSHYILDVLGAVGSDAVAFDFKDGLTPVAVGPVSGADYRCIVMPLRPGQVG